MKKQPLSGPSASATLRRDRSANLSPPGGARGAIYALLFGLFLGLAIWKFGNPVILDQKIIPPASFAEVLADAWPTHWINWLLPPFVLAGGWLALSSRSRWPGTRWLWLLPLLWFGWQLLSATHTVDAFLTTTTLWQFGGCVACYFIGVLVLGRERGLRWLLIGVLAAFTFCLVRAVDQRLFEFPESRRMLVEGEHSGWTNFPPEMLLEMKRNGMVITTNGMDVANPAILARITKNRVMGTFVYPNALAGAILLLLPVSLALAFNSTRPLKPPIRGAVIAMTCLLGGLGLFWSGSKAGWLIGMALAGIWLFHLNWSGRLKWAMLTTVLVVGFAVFAVRFHNYFTTGATSVGARFDYWRAAVQTTRDRPLFGTGPGTFQRPYAQIKSPDAEMARLTHNDYLEQFSDSGIPGGICYAAWIGLALLTVGQRAWRSGDYLQFSLFLGLLGWFAQGLVEFSLYVPALAWTAFTLLGCLLRMSANQFDKGPATG